jgi:hypothetical protein
MNGFDNENQIRNTINSVPFYNLSSDLKNALIKINDGNTPNSLSAEKYGGIDKADLSITIDNNKYFVSVKKGTGNSVHQEPIEEFIVFLRTNFEDDNSVFNDLRHFIWGDGTLNGTGNVENRISASKYKKEFPEKVENIQNYFNKHKIELLERFLITGAVSNKKADYLFYGDINNCKVVSDDDMINFASNINKRPISIGVLTFQAWNRNINGGNKSEHKRGQIQLKWGGLKDDIKNI